MKLSLSRILAGSLVCLLVGATAAHADTFAIQWYTAPTGSVDFYNGGNNVPIGTSTNYVASTLGPNGLPVFNSNFSSATGTVLAPNSIYLNSSNELLYWTPTATNNIVADGAPTTISISTNPNSPTVMYPPNLGTDANFEATAVLSGSFTVLANQSDTVTFDVGADDTAFVYVNGNLIEDLGGIHGDTALPSTINTYGPGTYNIQIFYADHDVTQAALSFSDDSNLTITPTLPTPEPSTLMLLGTGLIGAAGAIRRRIR